ncbi:hypothetical protein AB0J47_23700 [Nocardia sp. NPDC049737]|uniref:hypothetical protein n=1 Tax=Nocardia sp. NPDC049737 TaxID=3154358 RepID=UPI00344370DE
MALDVARVLTADPDSLARTDIADHAVDALRHSGIREVILLGRRGLPQAAYTGPEFLALGQLPGIDIVVDPADLDDTVRAALSDPGTDPATRLKLTLAAEYASRARTGARKRIVFRFHVSPTSLSGKQQVDAVHLVRNELHETPDGLIAVPTAHAERLDATLVLRAVGYRGAPVPDVPFDPTAGVIPNEHGRVLDSAAAVIPGVYATGWIKRGPRGVIGTNRRDAEETVAAVVDDFLAGRLTPPRRDREALSALLTRRCPNLVDRDGWGLIDAAERANGAKTKRPRVKFIRLNEMVDTARRG